MYVARYWRMQSTRYQLEATQYEDESVSLQNRPIVAENAEEQVTVEVVEAQEQVIQETTAA